VWYNIFAMTFRDQVYVLIRKIPKGKVATYGQVAKLVGSPGAARAVGMCMKTNPDAPRTPCHRIVAADGRLTGYSAEGGIAKKKIMLRAEGVMFDGDRVNLRESLWNPNN
jgi:O-6-methylguanine DNA methyltransferase